MPRIRSFIAVFALGAATHGGPLPAQEIAPHWMDAPITPGDWTYIDQGAFSFATYGTAQGGVVFGMRCDKANHKVSLDRISAQAEAVPMRIETESMTRLFTADPEQSGQVHILRAQLPAADPFLDAMALSKGRFAVELVGEPTLYLPSWPEVTRVIEDCR